MVLIIHISLYTYIWLIMVHCVCVYVCTHEIGPYSRHDTWWEQGQTGTPQSWCLTLTAAPGGGGEGEREGEREREIEREREKKKSTAPRGNNIELKKTLERKKSEEKSKETKQDKNRINWIEKQKNYTKTKKKKTHVKKNKENWHIRSFQHFRPFFPYISSLFHSHLQEPHAPRSPTQRHLPNEDRWSVTHLDSA